MMISYRVYCNRRKIEQWEKPWTWPFIWYIGIRIQRSKRWYEVRKIVNECYSNRVKIYVKELTS